MLDEICEKLGMDKLEFRLKNLPPTAPDAMWAEYFKIGAKKFGTIRQDFQAVLDKAGQPLPVAAYGRDTPATTAQLLQPPPQAVPERNVELRRRSEERTDDPFDLPPKE